MPDERVFDNLKTIRLGGERVFWFYGDGMILRVRSLLLLTYLNQWPSGVYFRETSCGLERVNTLETRSVTDLV
jgi:hypothetical protein